MACDPNVEEKQEMSIEESKGNSEEDEFELVASGQKKNSTKRKSKMRKSVE